MNKFLIFSLFFLLPFEGFSQDLKKDSPTPASPPNHLRAIVPVTYSVRDFGAKGDGYKPRWD